MSFRKRGVGLALGTLLVLLLVCASAAFATPGRRRGGPSFHFNGPRSFPSHVQGHGRGGVRGAVSVRTFVDRFGRVRKGLFDEFGRLVEIIH